MRELLESQPFSYITGKFQPGHGLSLKLNKTLSLHELYVLEEGLKNFLQPIDNSLDMLVFFKLHQSVMFDKYLQVYLRKESETGVKEDHSATALSLTKSTCLHPWTGDQSGVEGFPICVLQRALNRTHDLIIKLMQGTVTYFEVVTEAELSLETLNIVQEFSTFYSFSETYLKPTLDGCEGLAGVESMLKLFQYIHHIQTVHCVCEQYQLHGCLKDPQLLELCQQRVQAILLEWKQKFIKQPTNYDEVLIYIRQQEQLEHFGQTICTASAVDDIQDIVTVISMLLNTFEQLNVLLTKYVPGQPDIKWCTLPSLLQGWGVALPPHLLEVISQHVLFPGEEKAVEFLNNDCSTDNSGLFEPSYNKLLKLTKALFHYELSALVKELNALSWSMLEAMLQNLKELRQYIHYVPIIRSVCKQCQLQGCLEDCQLLDLCQVVENLNMKAKLKFDEACRKVEWMRNVLCFDNKASPCCLELFVVVSDSTAFYQFVCDKQFVGEKGQAVFQQQYQLITTQLQHDEYDETVLNHLYAAFKLIEPFMDTHQNFRQLMSKVISLDVTNGIKQLQTVKTNITLVQLWFFRAEGDTFENVAKELGSIIKTGSYFFHTSSSVAKLMLEYIPFIPSSKPSCSLRDPGEVPHKKQLTALQLETETKHENEEKLAVNVQHMNSEQIDDFVHKLGLLNTEKEGEDKIKHFLHINETARKLLDLCVCLRKLGQPKYTVQESLQCNTNREEADQRVQETDEMLTTWADRVDELRNQYDWLLFFSMPKLLLLYDLLQAERPNPEAIVHEISFICSNQQPSWENVQKLVEKSLLSYCKHRETDSAPLLVVGKFLHAVFNNHSLPKRCGEGISQPLYISQPSFPASTKLLHYCPGYSQAQLIRLIVSIYNGVPEPFEVFRCDPSSTDEELSLFLKRVSKHPLQYLILGVNLLPFKLQEYLMRLNTVIQEREVKCSSKPPCIHLVETAPSVLRKMPWIVLKERTESGPNLNLEKARKICRAQVVQDFACVQLVYGHAGDGKTHYIKQQLSHHPASQTISVNEAFTPLKAISKLRTLPLNQRNCAIFFNFTMLPPGGSVDESEQVHYQQLMEVIGWFFFDLLMLNYVEDYDTGLSFRIPGGLAWTVYIEVPSHDHSMPPEEALKHFQQEVPALGLLGTPHYIDPDTPYTVDEEVQLVCKYLKALKVEKIDKLYQEGRLIAGKEVKFSSESDLKDKECQELLLHYMPDHVRNKKITQRLFVKYMNRRCSFLDNLPAFYLNMGRGEYITDEQGNRAHTDTRQLGSTLITTMLREVEDFCDPAIKENWSLKPHQQLIYDFKDGGASLGLISLHPENLPKEDKMKFKKIGVKIPSMIELYSRELLDKFLSRALNVKLEDGRLSVIDNCEYVLTLDYTIKMLNIHERYQCGVPVIIEGETGVGKTALLEMLSKLWNQSLLLEWKRQCDRLLELMRSKLGDISIDVSENYEACVQIVEALSAGQHVSEEDLLLLVQLRETTEGQEQLYSGLRSFLLKMRADPVITLLTLEELKQQEASLEQRFKRAETEDSAESTASLLYGVLNAQIKPTFHKLNVHAALTPDDIWSHLEPAFIQAQKLLAAFENNKSTPRAPSVTVFLDEVNTSSCLGLFKEIIVDKTFDGNPIPDNVFIVAACNPHRGNSLASHCQKTTWVRGSYYIRQLHPTLRFLMWDYGSLDEDQERDYINAKMKMVNRQMPNLEVASLTDLIMTSQNLMRHYAFCQLQLDGLDIHQAKVSSRSCVSQRDIQRVFTFYQWLMVSYTKYKPYGERQDYSRRAVLVSLGIVYYMRLDHQYRKEYQNKLDKEVYVQDEVVFSQVFSDELDWYINQVELPTGISKTRALKENLFAIIVCTVTHTPVIIVGAPGSSKTLSFNLAVDNLKGLESKISHFRETDVFQSLNPYFYQCSRQTTFDEIQTVFSRAINRQRSHSKFKLPIYCVVFMDEAGLPGESHESLKALHCHLDQQEVSFVGITNHMLDAAKTNRAVSVFRPEASQEDLETLAKGCLCTTLDNPPPELNNNMEIIVQFCLAYSHLMTKPEFSHFFGLRDFMHFVNYMRQRLNNKITPQLLMEALERNFNGSDSFDKICNIFFSKVQSSIEQVHCRSVREVLKDSLEDRPQQKGWDMAEAEVRYKLIIDPSEDDSLVRLLFSFGVLKREETHVFMCSDFPGNNKINTVTAIRHWASIGHTVVMTQADDIHESFYDLFNQRFRRIDDPKEGARYYANIAIGAHIKPSRVDPNFQCVVVIKKPEVKNTPAPFLNRFEKYCITHHSLLQEALSHLPPCIRTIVEAAMRKVKDFIHLISGPSSLYGLQPETLDSLVLSLLPPLNHTYESLIEPSEMKCSLDLKVLLMQELVQNLCHCAGFNIPPYSIDELQLDTHCLFDLVLMDSEFEGLLSNLSQSAVEQTVVKVMRVLFTPDTFLDGAIQLSPEGCLMVALLQQWLVRYFCKRLMQLMTSEAFILYRNVIPSSYLENYISFQAHFSLKELILKYLKVLEKCGGNPAGLPTKLLCFTRSSSLVHHLPAMYPSSVLDAQAASISQQTLRDLVFKDPSKLVVCTLSCLLSQSSVQEMLKEFVKSDKAKVCLLVVNMQETSRQVVNHLRIMIEEAELLSTRQPKLFVMLLHFPPAQFFSPCYPSLFLKGWDHCYLDTIAHSAGQGLVDVQDWLWQCCSTKDLLSLETDPLVLSLTKILPEAIPVLHSRVCLGSSQEESFNQQINGSQRMETLRELLFKKGVGKVLCERFQSYWKLAVMTEYLEKAAMFTKNSESTLSITDSVQIIFKSLFFDFLVCMLSKISGDFNIDILCDSDCTPAVQNLFLDILQVIPLPKLSELQILTTSLPTPISDHSPRFPFFKIVCEAVERIMKQSYEDVNVQLDLLQENESGSVGRVSIHDHCTILQQIVTKRIEQRMEATPRESLGLAVKAKEILVLAVEAMRLHPELWQHYFDDFLLHKLRLGGLHRGTISHQILHAFFRQMHMQEAVSRVVLLHCYSHVYQLHLAKMAKLLRPLDQIESTTIETHLLPCMDPEGELWQQLVSEHIATFVVNTLFIAIAGVTDVSVTMVPKKMTDWFQTYGDLMTPSVKQNVYEVLKPQRSESEKEGTIVVEARLTVMQAVFLAIQASPSLREEALQKGHRIFQTLLNRHFTKTLELRGHSPHLGEVMSVTLEMISETTSLLGKRSVQILMEGLFAHFFSPYRRGYHTEDIQWFLELANKQKHWGVKSLQHQPQKHHQVTRTEGAISISVFKLYLGHILGTCHELAALSGPLQLYYHQPRSQVGSVLMATPDLGSPAPYIPTFYQECSSITPRANHENQRMQQPLAHLYFVTLLEHLQAKEYKLSGMISIASAIIKQCASPATEEVKKVILWVELQAVVQVVLQKLANHLDPSKPRLGGIKLLMDDINRLLDDVETGGGDTQGHGMVLALHVLKQLKSSHKFSELLTEKYESICHWLHCLQPFHQQLTPKPHLTKGLLAHKPHLLPFMLPGAEKTELGALYFRVSRVMVGVHEGREKVKSLIHIAKECNQSLQMKRGSPPHSPIESSATTNEVDKRHCFRMMVWLCAYYDFFDKKVTSKPLCNVMGDQLAPYLGEKGCIRLIQCFLDPQLIQCHRDPLRQLFLPSAYHIDQSDIDLRHSLANLVGMVLGCPSNSNHLWYHLFSPRELHGTYMTGFMYNAKISSDGLLYDCGVKLSPEGLFGHQDYVKHATRGTYTLHSLYLLLWANFGTFCMALLTQPEAEAAIHGAIISKWLSVRQYCVSQLRTVWKHMQENLGLSDEERSFLVMCCTKSFYKLFKPGTTPSDHLHGIFKTCQELDNYEKIWHTHIYQPSWTELKTEFAWYSQLWLNKLFIEIRSFGQCYPHFPSERDFIHSLLSSGDIQSYTQGEDLYLLGRFTQEWPWLQAGGLLLPDLVEFYKWLHTALVHLVTKERAASLPIGRVVELAVQRYSKKEGEHLKALYSRVKDGCTHYVKVIGGTTGTGQNNIYTIADNIPLLQFLSVDEEEGNDWLYSVVEDIIAAHNAFIKDVYTSVQAQQSSPLAHLLPDEPEMVYPSEVNDSSCIVGKFRSVHGISDFLQLVRSRCQPSSKDAPTEFQQHKSTSPGLLWIPGFQFNLLQEDIVSYFIAGKPLIFIEPSSVLRTPFRFRQSPCSAAEASDVLSSILNVDNISDTLSDTFKAPLEESLQKQLEYEFHSASCHTILEVVIALKNVAGHLVKALMKQGGEGLEQQTVHQFMLTLYKHLKESEDLLKEIGVHSTSPSQLACLVELPLSSLFSCLQLFTSWVRDGVYNFAALPFGLKTCLSSEDLQSLQQIPFKWTGSHSHLLEEITQMIEVLRHSETCITKAAKESTHKPLMQYLKEILLLRKEDHLPSYIPSSILIQHYVYFRIALKRLALTVQKQVEEVGENAKRKQWREVVDDLWVNQLPHLRSCNDATFEHDKCTGQYGFQEDMECDSEGELMNDLINKPKKGDHIPNVDTQALEQKVQEYTPQHVGQFLEGIGLGHHVTTFIEEGISGDVLFEPDQEMLEELGVTSAIERLKIKVLFRRSVQGGETQYPLQSVLDFLKLNKLDKYRDTFQKSGMDGDLLLEADDRALKELGVSSAVDRKKIKTKYKTFVKSQQ